MAVPCGKLLLLAVLPRKWWGNLEHCVLRSVLLQIGGSGVLVQPMTYIFDEEPLRWQRLLENLGEISTL